ncbi:MAG: FAD-dependent monooxygenase [Bacteroidetes bacterium]|nr:FAD-dependent monooxygenase [Bacteroidota bacterium]MCH8525154.1 FAD-dependent monooxygenase [Balneolales bacterium]
MKKIAIIGGGIGGLSTANCLQHHGIDFDVFEQAPELTEIGAGVGLSAAPIQILSYLGLDKKLMAAGAPISGACMMDKHFHIIRQINLSRLNVCIHRARLIDILSENIPSEKVHLNKKAFKIEDSTNSTTGATQVKIYFDDGSTSVCDVLIVADGINSAIRRQLFPEIGIRFSNHVIWRGITTQRLPGDLVEKFIEIWDRGRRFLCISIDSDRSFWLALDRGKPGGKDNPDTIKQELLHKFADFDGFAGEFIRNTENIIRNDLADLGGFTRDWHKGNVVFVGDSIHATTPNLAQGACQAIEDAWCLAKCLKKAFDAAPASGTINPGEIFADYQKRREKKVMEIVRISWLFGKLAHAKSPAVNAFSRLMWRLLPSFVMRKQEKQLNDLSYND